MKRDRAAATVSVAAAFVIFISGRTLADEGGAGQQAQTGQTPGHATIEAIKHDASEIGAKVKKGAAKGADATNRGLHKAADATDHGLHKAADATKHGLEKAGEAVKHAANRTEAAIHKHTSQDERAPKPEN